MDYREYLTRRVEKLADSYNLLFLEARDWGNTGWWIFKDDNGATQAKVHFDFQHGYCSIREGYGNVFPGVLCHYGNDIEENKVLDFIKSKFPKELDLNTRLSDAVERSAKTGVAGIAKDEHVKE